MCECSECIRRWPGDIFARNELRHLLTKAHEKKTFLPEQQQRQLQQWSSVTVYAAHTHKGHFIIRWHNWLVLSNRINCSVFGLTPTKWLVVMPIDLNYRIRHFFPLCLAQVFRLLLTLFQYQVWTDNANDPKKTNLTFWCHRHERKWHRKCGTVCLKKTPKKHSACCHTETSLDYIIQI